MIFYRDDESARLFLTYTSLSDFLLVLFCLVLFCFVLFCFVLFCFVHSVSWCIATTKVQDFC